LVDIAAKLDPVYQKAEKVVERRTTPEEEELYTKLVAERDGILKEALDLWLASHQVPKGKAAQSKLNNAVIIAHQIYLTKPWVFADLFHLVNDDLAAFVREMKTVAELTAKEKLDPYDAVVRHTEELRARQSVTSPAAGQS
jgi:predicted aminopeptidase